LRFLVHAGAQSIEAFYSFDRMFVHCFWRNRTIYFLPLAINLDRQIAPQIRFDS
jgi:hypothetical protein